jgi:hypothetical protein
MTDETTTPDTTTTPADQGAGNPSPKWWEGERFTDDHRTALTSKGLAVDDPIEAVSKLVDMQVNAERKLSLPADQLLTRPKKDQPVNEWMRENAALFGIPDAPEKYEVKPPESWPKGSEWDTALEVEARKIAHEEGLSGKALQRYVDMYAGAVGKLATDAQSNLAAAQATMMTDLQKDWGAQAPARMARATQAASVVGEKLGLSNEGMLSLAQSLTDKTGDAAVIKLFDLIGDMMGGDSAIGIGKGSGALGMTPAEARSQIAALRAPDGAYYKASASGDQRELARLQPEIDRLTKIAAGG